MGRTDDVWSTSTIQRGGPDLFRDGKKNVQPVSHSELTHLWKTVKEFKRTCGSCGATSIGITFDLSGTLSAMGKEFKITVFCPDPTSPSTRPEGSDTGLAMMKQSSFINGVGSAERCLGFSERWSALEWGWRAIRSCGRRIGPAIRDISWIVR